MADMIMSSSLDPSILASLRSVDPNSSRWKETSLELDRLRSTIRTYQEAEYNQARQISEFKIKYENSEQRRESEKKAAEDEKRKMQAQCRRESEDHQRDEHKHAEARVQAEKKQTNLIKEIDDLKRVIRHKDDEWRRVYDQVQTEANTSQRANAELKRELLISRDQLAVTSQELEKNRAIVEEQRKKIEELELNTKSLNTSLLSSVFPPLTLPSFNEPMLRELTFNFLHKIEKQAEEQLFAELDSENEHEEEQTIAKMSEKEMPPPAGTEQKESAATEESSKPQQESKTQP